MLRKTRISLLMILIAASIGLATNLTAIGQTTDSAAISPTIPVAASSCDEKLAVALERLDKTLDAYEKAMKALAFSQDENRARKSLDDLKNELLAAKDQYIADVLADNKFLRGQRDSVKSKIRKVLETAEKILLIGAGIYLGRL